MAKKNKAAKAAKLAARAAKLEKAKLAAAKKASFKLYVKVAIVAAIVGFATATYSKWVPVAKDLAQKVVDIVKVEPKIETE